MYFISPKLKELLLKTLRENGVCTEFIVLLHANATNPYIKAVIEKKDLPCLKLIKMVSAIPSLDSAAADAIEKFNTLAPHVLNNNSYDTDLVEDIHRVVERLKAMSGDDITSVIEHIAGLNNTNPLH